MICGLVLKYLNMSGLVMIGRYETTLPYTSQFTLPLPSEGVIDYYRCPATLSAKACQRRIIGMNQGLPE